MGSKINKEKLKFGRQVYLTFFAGSLVGAVCVLGFYSVFFSGSDPAYVAQPAVKLAEDDDIIASGLSGPEYSSLGVVEQAELVGLSWKELQPIANTSITPKLLKLVEEKSTARDRLALALFSKRLFDEFLELQGAPLRDVRKLEKLEDLMKSRVFLKNGQRLELENNFSKDSKLAELKREYELAPGENLFGVADELAVSDPEVASALDGFEAADLRQAKALDEFVKLRAVAEGRAERTKALRTAKDELEAVRLTLRRVVEKKLKVSTNSEAADIELLNQKVLGSQSERQIRLSEAKAEILERFPTDNASFSAENGDAFAEKLEQAYAAYQQIAEDRLPLVEEIRALKAEVSSSPTK